MEFYLERLADLILEELGRKNLSCVCFAELCGISRNEIGKIIRREKTDIKLSTIYKICENSEINIEDVLCCKRVKINEIEVFVKNGKEVCRFVEK